MKWQLHKFEQKSVNQNHQFTTLDGFNFLVADSRIDTSLIKNVAGCYLIWHDIKFSCQGQDLGFRGFQSKQMEHTLLLNHCRWAE